MLMVNYLLVKNIGDCCVKSIVRIICLSLVFIIQLAAEDVNSSRLAININDKWYVSMLKLENTDTKSNSVLLLVAVTSKWVSLTDHMLYKDHPKTLEGVSVSLPTGSIRGIGFVTSDRVLLKADLPIPTPNNVRVDEYKAEQDKVKKEVSKPLPGPVPVSP